MESNCCWCLDLIWRSQPCCVVDFSFFFSRSLPVMFCYENPELGSPSPPVLWARQSEFGSSDHDDKFLFPKLGSPSEIRQILNYELGTNATLQRFLLIWSLSCYWVYMHINTLKQCTIRSYLLSLCNIWHNVLMHIFWKCLGQCSCSSRSKHCQINSLPHIGMQTVSDLCLPHAFASLSYK